MERFHRYYSLHRLCGAERYMQTSRLEEGALKV